MNIKRTISLTEARRRIFEITEDVQTPGTYFTLTANGKPKAVLLSAEEYESLIETIDVLQEIPTLAEDIKDAHEEYIHGETVPLEHVLKEKEMLVADKGTEKYASSPPHKKSKKATRKNS